MKKYHIPCALTAAGSDSGGGAGIEADILTFAANGTYACAAISALTAQNPHGVFDVLPTSPKNFLRQLEAAADFYSPAAAKTGMLFNAENVRTAADFFARYRNIALVVDPVMIATSGARLLKEDAERALAEELLPLSTLFTPNLDEAAVLAGIDRRDISDCAEMREIAVSLARKFSAPVLVKGGHLEGEKLADILANADGIIDEIHSERVFGVNTHGSGCTLSAAITANIAKGADIREACRKAQQYLLAGMKNPLRVNGECFINHFAKI